MIKEKYNNNIGLDYFYNIFKRLKRKYPKGYFFNRKFKKNYNPIDASLFKNLISTYLDIYFKDFYSHNNIQYFPLSGELTKSRGKGFYKNKQGAINTESINWIWFLRPAMNYVTNVKMTKLKGGKRRLDILEKEYKNNFDVGLLPKTNVVLKELNTNNKLYAQW